MTPGKARFDYGAERMYATDPRRKWAVSAKLFYRVLNRDPQGSRFFCRFHRKAA